MTLEEAVFSVIAGIATDKDSVKGTFKDLMESPPMVQQAAHVAESLIKKMLTCRSTEEVVTVLTTNLVTAMAIGMEAQKLLSSTETAKTTEIPELEKLWNPTDPRIENQKL